MAVTFDLFELDIKVHFAEKLLFSMGTERVRLRAEAKAAEDARGRAEAEAKRKRDHEREAARQALLQACTSFCLLIFLQCLLTSMQILLTLLQMEKTVEINDYYLVLKDLVKLTRIPARRIPMSLSEMCPGHYFLDDVEGFGYGGSNPMQKLGLFMKVDDEEEEAEHCKTKSAASDVEEGEIV
ncbi:hypothetical protein BHM03_00055669 [Ensete ventricosum]|nr:hypothetical protein BHM03_00055669 [Ensete ventricosum]